MSSRIYRLLGNNLLSVFLLWASDWTHILVTGRLITPRFLSHFQIRARVKGANLLSSLPHKAGDTGSQIPIN